MDIRLRWRELLFYIAFFLTSFSKIVLNGSYGYKVLPPGTNTVVKYVAIVLLIISVFQIAWESKRLIIWGICITLGMAVTIIIDKPVLMLYVLLLLSVNGIDFERVKRFFIISSVICTLFVLTLCLCGAIPDQVYSHDGNPAHSFGFLYYSNLSNIIMFDALIFFSFKNRRALSWCSIIFWSLLNFIIYRLATTRLTFYLYLLGVILYIVIVKIGIIRIKNNKFWRSYSSLAFPAMALLCIIVSYMYNTDNEFLVNLNSLLVGRIMFNNMGLNDYGITLFGQKIKMVGGTSILEGADISEYFFIDSGYIYCLLVYGVIAFLIIILLYSYIYRYSVIANNKVIFVLCTVICIHSLINDAVINLEINPLLLMLPTIFKEMAEIRRRHGIRPVRIRL